MSRIGRTVVVVVALMTEMTFGQEAPKLISFAPLLANPQAYVGQTVAMHGIINQSDAETGSFKLMESQTPRNATQHAPILLATPLKGAKVVSVQNGQEAIVIGQIQIRDKAPILQVVNIISDKDTIRRFIRPSERRPRPGDNLGHDAQPSRSISE
jgi:hypothetical protein